MNLLKILEIFASKPEVDMLLHYTPQMQQYVLH
jgi:hypothetical protein